VDVPTNWGVDTGVGGTVRGNYATLNPVAINYVATTYSNGNLEGSAIDGNWFGMQGTVGVLTGKWYWEVTVNTSTNIFVGIARATAVFQTQNPQNLSGTIVYFASDGNKRIDGTDSAYGASCSTGDVIGVALDLDANTVTFYKNNSSQGAISLASTTLNGNTILPFNVVAGSGTKAICNFGQRPFAYTAPSGFKALNTQNLPTPTIGATPATQAGKFFNTVTYTGTQTTQSVTGVGFQPDFVWNKDRSGPWPHVLTDVVRGVGKSLYTNSTEIEVTNDANGHLSAFNSDGFTLAGGLRVNSNGNAIVAWNWKANGAGVTNTAGSITSTVSANTTSGFSVVTWTGNNSTATVGHGLGAAPAMYIVKNRSNAGGWVTYHRSLGATQFLTLQSTDAATTSSNPWNNTAPTSTVFTIGSGSFGNTNNYVTYCFAEVAGFSKFGSYTGNGSNSGPFIYCGFRPAFIMIKNAGSTGAWGIFDARRNPSNGANLQLQANSANAEGAFTVAEAPDLLSNGFKLNFSYADFNSSGVQYVFMALAEAPQKFALAR
jgi:hypothetical protein